MFISSKNHCTEIPWNVSSLNEGNAPYIGKANLRPKEYNTQFKKKHSFWFIIQPNFYCISRSLPKKLAANLYLILFPGIVSGFFLGDLFSATTLEGWDRLCPWVIWPRISTNIITIPVQELLTLPHWGAQESFCKDVTSPKSPYYFPQRSLPSAADWCLEMPLWKVHPHGFKEWTLLQCKYT